MKIVDEQWEFLKDVAKLINFAEKTGLKLTGGELFRTQEQQAIYFQIGLSKTKISYHMKRLAIDFNFFVDEKLTYNHELISKMGAYWESLNELNRWGGNFANLKDTPHFERAAE
jgi:peptidoglycan L-alanyl-D-glutamate endopeptidase CwlK